MSVLSKLFEEKHLETLKALLNQMKIQSENNIASFAANEEDKKSKTPSANKKKPSNRKNSMGGLSPATSDDVQAHLNSTFYASFILSHLSKTLCISAALLNKKQLFEHVADLSANVNPLKTKYLSFIRLISNIYIFCLFIWIDIRKILFASSYGDCFAKR